MKALVVFDTYFGNTEQVALAIGDALGTKKTVTMVKVDQVDNSMLDALDILIVGSPTRAFSPTPGITKFLKKIPPNGLAGVKVATFDTRLPINEKTPRFLRFMVKFFGYANKPLYDLLIKKGGQSTVDPEGFLVQAAEGPLLDGELERAVAWAKEIKTI